MLFGWGFVVVAVAVVVFVAHTHTFLARPFFDRIVIIVGIIALCNEWNGICRETFPGIPKVETKTALKPTFALFIAAHKGNLLLCFHVFSRVSFVLIALFFFVLTGKLTSLF